MKKLKQRWNYLSARLIAVCLVMVFMASSCEQGEDINPESLEALEEFESGQEAEYEAKDEDFYETILSPDEDKNIEFGTMIVETLSDGTQKYYDGQGNKLPKTEIKAFSGTGFLANAYLIMVLYESSHLGGRTYSLYSSNSKYNQEYTFTLNQSWKINSFIAKGNALYRFFKKNLFTGHISNTSLDISRINQGGVKRNYFTYEQDLHHKVYQIKVTSQNNKDATAMAYSDSQFRGHKRPFFGSSGNITLGIHWKDHVSSIEINRTDYPTGNVGVLLQSDLAIGVEEETKALAVFTDWTAGYNGWGDNAMNDHIIKILLGRKYAKTCFPKSVCFRNTGCTGPTIANYTDGNGIILPINGPRRCHIARQQRNLNHNGSYCTRNGRCINPATGHGFVL